MPKKSVIEKIKEGLLDYITEKRIEHKGIQGYPGLGVSLSNPIVETPPGIYSFLRLTDTPVTYTGQAGKYCKVKSTEDSLEFSDVSGAGIVPATLVVAASDSKDTSRADYICPGASDESKINEAIGDLPSGIGGCVVLLEGNYVIDGSISLPSNVILKGCGRNTKIKIKDSLDSNLKMIVNSDISSGNEGINVFNLRLDGNQANQSAGDQYGIYFQKVGQNFGSSVMIGSVIEDCWVENMRKTGIYLTDCNNNIVKNNKVIKNLEHGIYLTLSSMFNLISSNLSHGNNMNGIYVSGATSGYNVISNNQCVMNGESGIRTYDGVQFLSITNNVCFRNTYWGIFVGDANNDSHYVSVLNNVCYDSQTYEGIKIQRADSGSITGNTCKNNKTFGIFLYNSNFNTINGNVVHYNQQHGIRFQGATSNALSTNQVLDNNRSNGNYDGINLYQSSNNNIVQGNIVRKGTYQRYGIRLESNVIENSVLNNDLGPSPFIAGVTANLSDVGARNHKINNTGAAPTEETTYLVVKNTSGAQIDEGKVVILKSAAAGDEIETTVIQGDDKIFGMLPKSIGDNDYGMVLTKGKTTILKVDGTLDIAIGDFLGAFTTAGIAMKASAGDMAFAIALEAYATNDSNGIIDALLVIPRKI